MVRQVVPAIAPRKVDEVEICRSGSLLVNDGDYVLLQDHRSQFAGLAGDGGCIQVYQEPEERTFWRIERPVPKDTFQIHHIAGEKALGLDADGRLIPVPPSAAQLFDLVCYHADHVELISSTGGQVSLPGAERRGTLAPWVVSPLAFEVEVPPKPSRKAVHCSSDTESAVTECAAFVATATVDQVAPRGRGAAPLPEVSGTSSARTAAVEGAPSSRPPVPPRIRDIDHALELHTSDLASVADQESVLNSLVSIDEGVEVEFLRCSDAAALAARGGGTFVGSLGTKFVVKRQLNGMVQVMNAASSDLDEGAKVMCVSEADPDALMVSSSDSVGAHRDFWLLHLGAPLPSGSQNVIFMTDQWKVARMQGEPVMQMVQTHLDRSGY